MTKVRKMCLMQSILCRIRISFETVNLYPITAQIDKDLQGVNFFLLEIQIYVPNTSIV